MNKRVAFEMPEGESKTKKPRVQTILWAEIECYLDQRSSTCVRHERQSGDHEEDQWSFEPAESETALDRQYNHVEMHEPLKCSGCATMGIRKTMVAYGQVVRQLIGAEFKYNVNAKLAKYGDRGPPIMSAATDIVLFGGMCDRCMDQLLDMCRVATAADCAAVRAAVPVFLPFHANVSAIVIAYAYGTECTFCK